MIFNPSKSQKLDYHGEEKAKLLESVSWFNFLKWPQLVVLSDYVSIYAIPEATGVFEEGSKDLYMGIIVNGTVDIIKRDAEGRQRTIASLKRGSVFGELALIDRSPRSATAFAATDITLIVLTEEKFIQLAHDKSRLAFDILHRIATLVSQRLRQTSSRLVDALSEEI